MNILILLSTYNGVKYLEEQLDSIRLQQGVDVSLLIRDDGSKDNTLELISDYKTTFPEFKLELIAGKNVGFALSFSMLLELAYQKYQRGIIFDYYAFADQDDVWLPEKLLQASIKLGDSFSQKLPIAYCSNTTLVKTDLSIIGYGFNRTRTINNNKRQSIVQNIATGCTMVFNIRAVEIYVNHIPKVIKVHDFYMYQLCSFLGEVIYDSNSYILYRQHSNNQIGHPSAMIRWKNRFLKLGHRGNNVMEKQSVYLLDALKSELSDNDIKLISKVAYYKSNIYSRMSLLFNIKIRKHSLESDFFYRLKILIGCL